MILRKPYAFLIKHFRLIHLVLTLALLYVVRKTHIVVSFFNSYVSNGYSYQTGSDVSGLYINWFMLLSIFLIVVATIAIYYLLKYKEKPVRMYVVMVIYYVILFGMLFWYSGIISKMAQTVLSAKSARLYRDISLIIYVPQYIFIIFCFIRAVGFDIKKFNFQNDLKEMQITNEDNEEVEVGLDLDTYKTARFFRRLKREFHYYFIENKLIISVILVIVMFSSIIIFYKTRKTYDLSYSQNDQFVHQNFTVNIKDSIITTLDQKGNEIDDFDYYLVLKTYIKNNDVKQVKLDTDSFAISVGGERITPTLDRSTFFSDYANPYYGDYIPSGKEMDIALVYRLTKEQIKKSFKLKLLSSFNTNKDNLVTKYAIVNLNPIILDSITDIGRYDKGVKVSFANTNVGNSILTVTNYIVTTSYVYDYNVCYSDNNCVTKKDIASIDYTKGNGSFTLLVLDYDFDLDKETTYGKSVKNNNQFFTDFASIRSSKGNYDEEYDVIDVTPKTLKDKLVLQVQGDISNSDNLELLITIRNKRYIINLK